MLNIEEIINNENQKRMQYCIAFKTLRNRVEQYKAVKVKKWKRTLVR